MAVLIDGKIAAAKIKEDLRAEVAELKEQGIPVGLAVVIVGDDPASKVYVANKKKACEEIGIESEVLELPGFTTQSQLIQIINALNDREEISGILVQLPLPEGLDEKEVIATIYEEKDVDAFSYSNVGHVMVGDPSFLPCTPAGVMELLESIAYNPAGQDCVVIGRSNIVGKPMAMLLLHKDATVTICHSRTRELAEITKKADLIVAAVGRPKFVTEDMVKEGAVVIDVGMNRDNNGKLCGDVDFENVSLKVSAITPVPGGVGPMTIAMLMKNTVTAAKLQAGLLE